MCCGLNRTDLGCLVEFGSDTGHFVLQFVYFALCVVLVHLAAAERLLRVAQLLRGVVEAALEVLYLTLLVVCLLLQVVDVGLAGGQVLLRYA